MSAEKDGEILRFLTDKRTLFTLYKELDGERTDGAGDSVTLQLR